MDEDKASRFISSLVKSIQALCNGFVDFSTSIEVIGHIHLNIDRNVKLDYVLTEEVSKSASEGSTVFASHSYHSQSPSSVASKNTNDTSNHGQKSRKDNETDPLGLSALPREVPNTSKSDSQSSNRIGDNRNSSHTSSGSVGFSRNSDSETLRHERSSFQVEDSTNKRRKIGPFSQSNPHPAAKRNRPNDFGSDSRTVVKESGFEVIEIKEEPDEDVPAVFFGGSSSGQDIQTPDFSNVVMESLDRVSQLEQNTDLAGEGGDGMGEYKQPVFPVMFHQGDGMSSSAGGRLPGPSSDPQAIASTSGGLSLATIAVTATDDLSLQVKEDRTSSPTSPPPPPFHHLHQQYPQLLYIKQETRSFASSPSPSDLHYHHEYIAPQQHQQTQNEDARSLVLSPSPSSSHQQKTQRRRHRCRPHNQQQSPSRNQNPIGHSSSPALGAGSRSRSQYKQYTQELMDRAVRLVHQGHSTPQAARQCGVPTRSLYYKLSRCPFHFNCRGAGLLDNLKGGGRKRKQ